MSRWISQAFAREAWICKYENNVEKRYKKTYNKKYIDEMCYNKQRAHGIRTIPESGGLYAQIQTKIFKDDFLYPVCYTDRCREHWNASNQDMGR